MTSSLEETLANWCERASHARHLRHPRVADIIDELVADVRKAAGPYMIWHSESEAMLFSGLTLDALRRRFPRMLDQRDARWSSVGRRERQYRESALPRRRDRDALRANARDAARRAS